MPIWKSVSFFDSVFTGQLLIVNLEVSMSKLRPLNGRILVRELDRETKTKSGILLPESAKEKSNEGKVIAVAATRWENGQSIPLEVKTGETVIYSEYAGQKVKIDGEEYQILRADDVLAVIEK